jgi:periplasmic protein CpxP/Spy
MKAIFGFLSVIILLMQVVSLTAQPVHKQHLQGHKTQKTPEEIAKMQVEWMKKDLNLDEETRKKVYDVALKYSKQSLEERQRLIEAGDRKAMKARMTEINETRDKELKAILGDEKFELFKDMESERRRSMRQPR